jgi:predicted nucleic acid-binding protein
MSITTADNRRKKVMAGTVRARVARGVLELLEKIDVPEGKEVSATILETPTGRDFGAFDRAAGSWKGTLDVEAFLHGVTLVSLDEETAKIFGRERGQLRAQGLLIGDSVLWIAATALQYNLTLLTNDRRHFERIDGLRLESV